jgi:hypothetical protein
MLVEFEKLRALLDGLRAATSRFDLKLENIGHMLEGTYGHIRVLGYVG